MIAALKKLANKSRFGETLIYLALRVYSACYAVLFFFAGLIYPVQKNKIVFSNMKGKRFGDNPKYITEQLLLKNKNLDLVWLLNSNEDHTVPEGVRTVNNTVFQQVKELAGAKVWVDSNTKQAGFRKKKNQLYFETWHGSYGMKKIYGDIADKLSKIDAYMMKYNSARFDVMISNARRTTEVYSRAMWYHGEFIEAGSPRNDVFFQDPAPFKEKVDEYFKTAGKKLVLYAPTYRNNLLLDAYSLDFEMLKNSLAEKFGGEWIVLVRLHPHNLQDAEKFNVYNENVLNASQYDDMQELLAAADLLISDFSSCILDYVTKDKICFLYAADVEEYHEERDYYFDIRSLPFPLAENNEQMQKNISEFDYERYLENLHRLFDEVGLCETGHASETAAEYILNWMEKNQ